MAARWCAVPSTSRFVGNLSPLGAIQSGHWSERDTATPVERAETLRKHIAALGVLNMGHRLFINHLPYTNDLQKLSSNIIFSKLKGKPSRGSPYLRKPQHDSYLLRRPNLPWLAQILAAPRPRYCCPTSVVRTVIFFLVVVYATPRNCKEHHRIYLSIYRSIIFLSFYSSIYLSTYQLCTYHLYIYIYIYYGHLHVNQWSWFPLGFPFNPIVTEISIWRFPKMGVPPVIIHIFDWDFPFYTFYTFHFRVPFMETSKYICFFSIFQYIGRINNPHIWEPPYITPIYHGTCRSSWFKSQHFRRTSPRATAWSRQDVAAMELRWRSWGGGSPAAPPGHGWRKWRIDANWTIGIWGFPWPWVAQGRWFIVGRIPLNWFKMLVLIWFNHGNMKTMVYEWSTNGLVMVY